MARFDSARLASIFAELEAKLPDELLHRIFPADVPADIRNCLKISAKYFSSMGKPVDTTTKKSARHDTGGMITLFTDGASRGNPGEAGAGVVMVDGQGNEFFARGAYLGQCTNNMAEYQALLLGLTEAGKIGATQITVKMDSELIVKQINGLYRVKDQKLKPLYDRANKLLQQFDAYRVVHIRRAENHRADELANAGIDRKGTISFP